MKKIFFRVFRKFLTRDFLKAQGGGRNRAIFPKNEQGFLKILETFEKILGLTKILNSQVFQNFRDFSNISGIFLVRPRSKNRYGLKD